MNKKPLVSIIIPLYNSENHIKETINSSFNQSYQNIEIIIVDDGSTDNSIELVNEICRDKTNTKIISQKNSGAPSARNNGLNNSNGDYVLFLDSDDIFSNNYVIEHFLKQEDKTFDIVYGNEEYYNETFDKKNYIKSRNNKPLSINYDNFFEFHPITSAVLLKKSFIEKNKISWNKNLKSGQEFDFFLKCILNKPKIIHIDETTINIRSHNSPHRISNTSKEKKIKNLYNLIKECNLLLKDNESFESAYNYWLFKNAIHIGIQRQYKDMYKLFKIVKIKKVNYVNNKLTNFVLFISRINKTIGALLFYITSKAGYEITYN